MNPIKYIVPIVFLMFFIVGCETQTTKIIDPKISDSELKKFSGFEEYTNFINNKASQEFVSRGGGIMALASSNSMDTIAKGAESSEDYSRTNNQYETVDEADFVKTDGEYVYVLNNGVLYILNDENIISEISFSKDNYASNFFVKDNKLVVFSNEQLDSFYFDKYSVMPLPSSRTMTAVTIYDLEDIKNPKITNTFEFSGSYLTSRLIGDYVYLISQEYAGRDMPIIFAKDRIVPEIYYFNDYENDYNLNTIAGINIQSEELVDYKTMLLGYSNTVMFSENNIYVTYQNRNICNFWMRNCEDNSREEFIEIVVPKLKGELKSDIEEILSKDLSEEEEWNEISMTLNKFFEEIKDDEEIKDEYLDMFQDINTELQDLRIKRQIEDSKTIIQKFEIKDGFIEHEATGSVSGHLLNQFSLDEFDNNLRVATTIDVWGTQRITYNNVYVLNQDLEIIGQIEKIAQNESIYSTRFLGDKLYMVTFRQIDPFFVIDLSNPNNPEILGKLKIPGYSNYLHPISENIILGVGKETGENEWGGVSAKGVKLSLFDVSEFDNPVEVAKVEIGKTGSDSAILYDHKAFLYSKDKDIIVIPVTEVVEKEKKGEYTYNYKTWNGAYVFDSKLNELAKIKHSEIQNNYFDWWNGATISRSLYVDNKLFTISNKYVKINDIENDFDNINSIEFPESNNEQIVY